MQVLVAEKGKEKDKTQKTEPIQDIRQATLHLYIDGKLHSLNFIENGENAGPKVFEFPTNYGKLKITISLAPIYFVNTFENIIEELQKTGIHISRSPAVDLITGKSAKYFAIVVDGIASNKEGKPIVDLLSTRLVLINKGNTNEEIDESFFINDVSIKIVKLETKDEPTSVQSKSDKKETQEILVYPNPASIGSIINIDYLMPKKGEYFLELYDLSGNKICSLTSDYSAGKNEEGTFALKLPDGLASGTYIILLKDKEGKEVISSKLIVE
ncbi:MAG: T9SS type A sorting domain-containing protein [Candidatus Anstonellaceae archaeon]